MRYIIYKGRRGLFVPSEIVKYTGAATGILAVALLGGAVVAVVPGLAIPASIAVALAGLGFTALTAWPRRTPPPAAADEEKPDA